MSKPENQVEPPWRAGWRGARANALPGLALWAVAAFLVGAYYLWPAARFQFDRLAAFRSRVGVSYAIVSTGLFGGLLPFLFLRARGATRAAYPWRHVWFFVLFWSYKGLEVDLFYRLVATLFGPGTDLRLLVSKMLVDQFLYCPLIAVPGMVVAYAWREAHFSGERLRQLLAGRFFSGYWLPTLIANAGVWIPAVMLIYALPLPLQIPLFNVVLCFFTLLLAHLAARDGTV